MGVEQVQNTTTPEQSKNSFLKRPFFSEKFLSFHLVKICVGSPSMGMIVCNRGDKSKLLLRFLRVVCEAVYSVGGFEGINKSAG